MKRMTFLFVCCAAFVFLLPTEPAHAMHPDDVKRALQGVSPKTYRRIIYVGRKTEAYNKGWRLSFSKRTFTISSSKSRLIITYKSVAAIKLHKVNSRVYIYASR